MDYKLVVVGASLGGFDALTTILENLPGNFKLPIVVVQHRTRDTGDTLRANIQLRSHLLLVEPDDKTEITPGKVYLAPPNYHLLVEKGYFALSIDPPVEYSRPSIDVLFESAAIAFGPALIGVVLTGSNRDGAKGVSLVKEYGGYVIVQDPLTAESKTMPEAALALSQVDRVLPLEEIPLALAELSGTL
ncbi:MAG: CheB methylesterase [Chloroflexi bacterium]|jgi:two-component system chemotaxis response regulator CheB|nr:CheB methylesterase [Chloroflexota bacterium]